MGELQTVNVSIALQDSGLPWLTFQLAGEAFALPIRQVKEIIQFGGITSIPLTPPYIRGVINLRGAVVPVLDLAVRFDKPPVEARRQTCIVIVELANESQHLDVGLVVDAVSEVIDIPAEAIAPPPRFGARIRVDFMTGIANLDQHFVILLDLARILNLEELANVAQFEQAACPAG